MESLLESSEFEIWVKELPTPIAKPLIRVDTAFHESGEVECFLAGLDLFEAIVKWTAFLGIADAFQKLNDQHPFLDRKVMQRLYPRIQQVLEPRQALGKWIGCIRELYEVYSGREELCFVPELVSTLDKPNAQFMNGLDGLLRLRNDYTHGSSKLPSPGAAKRLWRELEAWLSPTLASLTVLCNYNLVQFYGGFHPLGEETEGFMTYQTRTCYRLHGYRYREARELRVRKPLRFRYPLANPVRCNVLHFFDADYKRSICLHPFVIFSDLEPHCSEGTKAFLFNELHERVEEVEYQAFEGSAAVSIPLISEEGEGSGVAAPLRQHFTQLKLIVSDGDQEIARSLPGFGRRSPVLRFDRVIDFHTKSFAGREDVLAGVLSFLGGPGGCIRIRGSAGLGKTALLAKLAREHESYLHYFVSNDRQTYKSSTFLEHVTTLIARRYELDIEAPNDASLSQLEEHFQKQLEGISKLVESEEAERLVIMIDALDESERYVNHGDESIVHVLPESIPKGVFFILSSRPELELDRMANLRFDLEPLSGSEVSEALRRLGWSHDEAEAVYDRSVGSPLYLRFVFDDIKALRLEPRDVGHLPAAVEGFYQRMWQGWSKKVHQAQQAAASKKRTPKQIECIRQGVQAKLMQEVVGLLAVAREPLDLDQLAQLFDGPDQEQLRKLIAPEHLGRVVIGRREFSLFHDTLRDYIRRISDPDDGKPQGEGLTYHEKIVNWCDWRRSPYGRRHLPHHLLRARRYEDLFRLFDDRSAGGFFRSKAATVEGLDELNTDLRIAVEAAREVSDIPKIVRYGVLRQVVRKVSSNSAVDGEGALLAELGRDDEVHRLVKNGDGDVPWQVFVDAFSADSERNEALAWTLLEGRLSIQPRNVCYLAPLAPRDPGRLLQLFVRSLDLESKQPFPAWRDTRSLSILVSLLRDVDRGTLEAWLGELAEPYASLGLALLAARTRDADLVDRLIDSLPDRAAGLAAQPFVEVVTTTAIAAKGVDHARAPSLTRTALAMLEHLSSLMGDELKVSLMQVVARTASSIPLWLPRLQLLGVEGEEALLLASLLASPARRWLGHPELVELASGGSVTSSRKGVDPRILELFNRSLEDQREELESDDFGALYLPALIGLLEGEELIAALAGVEPTASTYQVVDKLFFLRPSLGLDELVRIHETLERDRGGEGLALLADGALRSMDLTNPEEMYARWLAWSPPAPSEGGGRQLESAEQSASELVEVDEEADFDESLDEEEAAFFAQLGIDEEDEDDDQDIEPEVVLPTSPDGSPLPTLFLLQDDVDRALQVAIQTGADDAFWPLLLARLEGADTGDENLEGVVRLLAADILPDDEAMLEELLRSLWGPTLVHGFDEDGALRGAPVEVLRAANMVAFRQGDNQTVEVLTDVLADGAGDARDIIPWIRIRASEDRGRGEEMWEALRSFLGGRGLDFLGEAERELDKHAASHLADHPPEADEVAALWRGLPTGFTATRTVIHRLLIEAGRDQEALEPYLGAELDIWSLQRSFFGKDLPGWLLHSWALQVRAALDVERRVENLNDLVPQVFWSGWGKERRKALVMLLREKLRKHTPSVKVPTDEGGREGETLVSPELLARLFASVATGLVDSDWSSWMAIIRDKPLAAMRAVGNLALADCKLAVEAMDMHSDPDWREAAVSLLVGPGLEQDPTWLATVAPSIPASSTIMMLDQLVDELTERSWEAAESLCESIASRDDGWLGFDSEFPDDFFRKLCGRQPALAAKLARKLEDPHRFFEALDPEHGGENEKILVAIVPLLLGTLRTAFEQQYEAAGQDELERGEVLVSHAKTGSVLDRNGLPAQAGIVFGSIRTKIDEMPASWRGAVLEQVLPIMASTRPEETLDWIADQHIDAPSLEPISGHRKREKDLLDTAEALDPKLAVSSYCRQEVFGRWAELTDVLEHVTDQATLHECLEILLSEGLERRPYELGAMIGLVLENAERAGYRPYELIGSLARTLDEVAGFVEGARFENLTDLKKELERIALSEQDSDALRSGEEDGPTESELRALLTKEELIVLRGAEVALRQSSAGARSFGDPGLWEGQKQAILAAARTRWAS